MKNSRFLLSVILAASLSASAATTLESDEIRLDLRPSPRVAAATEPLTYSVRWAGASGCTHKALLSVSGYAGTETLSDVPVLVRLSTAIQGFSYDDFADPATGADLVFCDESETTIYPNEIDEWNTNGESLVWVRLPALAAGTAFKMGYGGTPATAAEIAASAHAVWSDYAGVWHMNEDYGTAFDSTANGLDAQPEAGTNALSDISQMVACEQGAVGRARVNATQLVTSGNHLCVRNYDDCQLGDTFAVSGWFHADVEAQFFPKLFWRDWANGGWGCEFHRDTVSRVDVVGGGAGSTTRYIAKVSLNSSAAAGWTWICIAYHGTSASLYQDGVLITNGTVVAVTDNGSVLGFGAVAGGAGSDSHAFVGQYDEIRLRGGSLSAARIRADYDMVANSGFVAVGAVETAVPASVEIRLDGEVFAGNLSGEGTVDWTPSAPGTYEFRHVSRLDGDDIVVESASFTVPGTVAEDLFILAEGDLAQGVSIRLGGATDGWTIHYTTDGSEPTAASPEYTGPFALTESATVKVVAVSDAHGWTSGVAEQRFDLAPPLAVTGATARQRYPWNGLVDVDFTLAGDPVRRYRVSLEATDLAGGTNLALRTVWENGGSLTNAMLDLVPGDHRLVWNAEADLPAGFIADQVAIDVRAEPINDTALYMVVDLSGGPNAKCYPVSYLPDVPEGGWTDEYKTDKLVLRRIEPGWFTMGSPEDEVGRMQDADPFDETQHRVSLTKTAYASVFETTQNQWMNVAGTNPSALIGSNRPVDSVSYSDLRGSSIGSSWPAETGVDASSFIGKLQDRVNGLAFDLPTDAQWEYVCRAGTVSALNNGKNLDAPGANLSEVARWWNNKTDGLGGYTEHATVGSYNSNVWGVFDMHGNVWEACLDWAGNDIGYDCEDPIGPASAMTGKGRVTRGGAWTSGDFNCRSATRVDGFMEGGNIGGFRLFLHDAPAVVEAPIMAPTGLTASTNRTGGVTLAWEPVVGAYAYQIRRSKTGDFKDGTWLNTVTNTTYADWTAEPRADYAYWVRAQFESGRVGQWGEVATGCRYKGYTVRFNANDGSGTMDDIECFFDQPRALPANAFERSGFNFLGWATNATEAVVFADGESVVNLAGSAGETVNLYALWSSTTYTVKFNANGGTGTMADQTIGRGSTVALRANTFARSGYVFQGWATSASGARAYSDRQSVKNLTEGTSITLYAVWKTLSGQSDLYLVIDLSSGSSSSSYPVSTLTAVPSGGWTDEYKTTKLVLRRVAAGSFTTQYYNLECNRNDYCYSSGVGISSSAHTVKISKAFYIGVFEVTQKQWTLVMGSNPSKTKGDMRPVDYVTYNQIRGSTNGKKWPSSSAVDSSSFMGKIRARTGLSQFDLPTEGQWEYACRAGTTGNFNNGSDVSKLRSTSNHSVVGTYLPNNWGLYNMHGNVREWCLDWFTSYGSDTKTDPKGGSDSYSCWKADGPAHSLGRIAKGGFWGSKNAVLASSAREEDSAACNASKANKTTSYPNSPFSSGTIGFRLCCGAQ